jgi:predicted ATPase
VSVGEITELRLTAFKSFADTVVPLAPLTVLIGRNGSGKSNALDALEVFSRLAKAEEVRDALDGNRRDAGPVRGGLEGCVPHGSDSFEIGVTVVGPKLPRATLDLRVQVRPQVQIVWERFSAVVGKRERTLLETQEPEPDRSDIDAAVWNGTAGRHPRKTFRSTHLLTAQLPLRLDGRTSAERQLLEMAEELLAILGGVFHLDPVPHLMRQYVPEQDIVLRRTAENLSASVARLKRDDRGKFAQLVRAIKELPDHDVRGIEIGKGGFGEVMLALKERKGRTSIVVPARQMSDGMLRQLAIATALLTGGGGLALETSSTREVAPLVLVIEELENGLHPSQAARVLDLIKAARAEQEFQVVITTHSPALLNALEGDDHPGVLVVDRDRTSGLSRMRRLVDLPGYYAMMAANRLGDAVAAGQLAQAGEPVTHDDDFDRLLGIA